MTIEIRNRINRLLFILAAICTLGILTVGYAEGIGDSVTPSEKKIEALGAWTDAKITMLAMAVISLGSLGFAYQNNRSNQAAILDQGKAHVESVKTTAQLNADSEHKMREWAERMNDRWAVTVSDMAANILAAEKIRNTKEHT